MDAAGLAAGFDEVFAGLDEPIGDPVQWEGERLLYTVTGSGFLKHMVRNLAGTLIEAGKGNLGANELRELLRPGCRRKAGPTLPARGLFLVSVRYPEDQASG